MKKLVLLGAGAIAAAAVAVVSPGVADSAPSAPSPYNVVGEPYGRAMAILKSQGVKAYFGGAMAGGTSGGHNVQQSDCIVSQQKVTGGGRMYLFVDCTQEAVDNATDLTPAGPGGSSGPSVGGNGITTVTATPVGPQPGMSVPGA